MRARVRAFFLGSLTLCLFPRDARAHYFFEDWESGVSRWRTADGAPVVIATDEPALCSSRYQHETRPMSGGRVFAAQPIVVNAGVNFCMSVWIRASSGAQPFIGVHQTDASGVLQPGGERWLVGAAGAVTTVTSDGQWHWYTAPFTVESGWQYVVVKDGLSMGGANPAADFDDINIDINVCPMMPVGSAHVVCTTPRAVCSDYGQCVQCTPSDKSACTGNTPDCDSFYQVCRGCDTSADCPPLLPICNSPIHSCHGCTSDAECALPTPACRASGVCEQCSQTNETQCGGATPACNFVTGTCGGPHDFTTAIVDAANPLDVSRPFDESLSVDAVLTAADATGTVDAQGAVTGSGCGCAVGSRARSEGSLLVMTLLLLLWWRRQLVA